MSSFTEYTTAGASSRNPLPLRAQRDPTSSDVIAPGGEPMLVGREWINMTTSSIFIYAGAGVWKNVSGGTGSFSSLTATAGNITANNGNLNLNTAGNKIIIATGTNASVGTSAAMSGTPGTVTVATTASSTTALIFYSRKTTGGTPGQVSITAQDGTGFTLTSTANETSTFNWWIINA